MTTPLQVVLIPFRKNKCIKYHVLFFRTLHMIKTFSLEVQYNITKRK